MTDDEALGEVMQSTKDPSDILTPIQKIRMDKFILNILSTASLGYK